MKVGDKVVFGRERGERTPGTVLKINRTTVQVRQDEARGSKKVGTKWRVHPSLVALAGAAAAAPEAVKPGRPEAEVLDEIRGVYSCLSPENLTCDGELPVAMVRKRGAALRRKLGELFREVGRTVSESEAYGYSP